MAVGLETQLIYAKILGSMLGKLVMLSPEVANFLLGGPGSRTRQGQKSRGGKHSLCLPLTL